MVLSSGVKGGLIGGAISALLLLAGNFIPGSGYLLLIMPIITGVLAAVFMAGPRNIGSGAGAGAVGAAIAGLITGIVVTVLAAINLNSVSTAELAARIREGMSASQLSQAGTTPEQLAQTIRDVGTIGIGACCILGGPILWALFGTLGGMLGQAFKPPAPPPSLYGQPYYGAGQPPLGYNKVNPNYPHPPQQIGGEQNPYGSQPPTGYNQPPAGYNQPPAGYNQPPTGYNQPPTGYNQPPTGYNQPPAGYNQPPNQQPPDERGRQG